MFSSPQALKITNDTSVFLNPASATTAACDTLSPDMDIHDTLIAFSFVLCLVLFLRALAESGS